MAHELILIVDDNEQNRRLARDVLQFAGFRTLRSRGRRRGLTLAAEHRPDLVLMDIRMPDMNRDRGGAEAEEDERTAAIRVVALTSSTMKGDRERFLADGFDGYLEKPIRVREFPDQIRSAPGVTPIAAVDSSDGAREHPFDGGRARKRLTSHAGRTHLVGVRAIRWYERGRTRSAADPGEAALRLVRRRRAARRSSQSLGLVALGQSNSRGAELRRLQQQGGLRAASPDGRDAAQTVARHPPRPPAPTRGHRDQTNRTSGFRSRLLPARVPLG